MAQSKIEWTESTWNPITGCTKISAGCKFCYAEVMARRCPINEEWVLDIKEQCQNAKVAFYFKQWGGTNKKKAGKMLNGKMYMEMPEFGDVY
ncbi:MAG: DUF5131 family protein [Bacteroidetes bacterium]|nr:DUF5131 family protein [Bacteroidota bacterium]